MLTKLLPKVSVFSNHEALDVILISRLRNVHSELSTDLQQHRGLPTGPEQEI